MSADVGNKITLGGHFVSADDVAQVLGNTGWWLGRVAATYRLSKDLDTRMWKVATKLKDAVENSLHPQTNRDDIKKICKAYYSTKKGESIFYSSKVGKNEETAPEAMNILLGRIKGILHPNFTRVSELLSLLEERTAKSVFVDWDSERFQVLKNAVGDISIIFIPPSKGPKASMGTPADISPKYVLSPEENKIYRGNKSQGEDIDSEAGKEILEEVSPILWEALRKAKTAQ